ncbi:hypothetical protein ACQPTN_05585 [Bradyrhizobium sp. 13971]
MWTVVHAEELSFKKTLLPAEQDRPDVARKRSCWKAHQGRINVARLVFIDKTWIKTNMAPLRGWRPCGQRLQAIPARGARRIFLPPYSPDLNPIAQVFAKLKHLVRAAALRDVEATWRKVGELHNLFFEEECTNHLKTACSNGCARCLAAHRRIYIERSRAVRWR